MFLPLALLSPLLLLPAVVSGGFCDEAGWSLSFADEFEGAQLNASNWNVLNGTSENDSSCRDAMCLASNVAVRGGSLVLTARAEKAGWASWTTGAVNSKNKRFFAASDASPFRLCVSGKLPGGAGSGGGLWPAFWMMPNDDSCWPDHGEMDLLEEIDGDGFAHATYHISLADKACTYNNSAAGGERFVPTLHSAFHEFAVERTATSLAFVYDSVVVWNSTNSTLPVLKEIPWYAILNFAIGGPWPKPVNASTVFPAEVLVDYVRASMRSG